MRKIKFRCWGAKYNESPKWQLGNIGNVEAGYVKGVSIPPGWILEQFTGLHDSKGREIYEGDILKSSRKYRYMYDAGYTGDIHFREHYADYEYGDIGGQITQLKADFCEVIGNIHENPELLDNA
jgi:uncharacterized phage protein (TIGR01671 family)